MPEGIGIDTRHPRLAGGPPALTANRLARLLLPLLVEPVDIEETVEVVVFVLHAPGEPAGCREGQLVAVAVDTRDVRAVPACEGEVQARHGQAAFGVVVLVRIAVGRTGRAHEGIDDHADLGHAVLVGQVPREDAQPDSHLRGSEPGAMGGGLSLEHVVDESLQLRAEVGDDLGPAVQHRLSGDGDGAHGHGHHCPARVPCEVTEVSPAPGMANGHDTCLECSYAIAGRHRESGGRSHAWVCWTTSRARSTTS
ncbi:hypothetical protein BN11_180021 [Nostocoides australiense Ben110]|uniref:Uncharacterized protein n=1 Tax=Nostocoides australiense Ben110 TaxID=1193182 RepID=W6JTH2_9MICO|nr:hypothetical protein BN11_180021 [Tetrasphaera australiensis Ben110]